MLKMRKSFVAFAVVSQLVLLTGLARANDPAAAEALFQEGRKLMAEGQIAAGCEKLKDSFALDPMSGTMLNLADCYEKQGKYATAWTRFQNAASLAKTQGKREQATEANRRMKSLEAEMSYLTIVVPDPVPGLEVRRDDMEVLSASYGEQMPSDSGSVVITATAPGYKPYKATVEIGARRDKKTVTLPKLVKLEKGEAAEPLGPNEGGEEPVAKQEPKKEEPVKQAVEETKPSTENISAPEAEIVTNGPGKAPWIIGGLGLAIAATGGVFGLMATQSNHDALLLCPSRRNCTQAALDAEKKRDNQAMVANIGVGAGLAVVAASAIWIAVGSSSSESRDSARVTLQPAIAPGMAGLWAATRF